ncbi:MAG: T9SS type A sorting domain-containing protein [Bacteroidetes bacterium]|nr:MAG: T9SS type A sorting domain-containing protein [Bacteroidota bacterium]
MKKYTLVFAFLFFLINISAGQSTSVEHKLSPSERLLIPDYLRQIQTNSSNGITQPPFSPVRASAEWEEIDALMITWTSYTSILKEIVRAAQVETKVLIICSDSTSVKNYLSSNSVPLYNIEYLIEPFNSIWCRDYGPWNVYTNDVDSLALIDWIYNRPRAKDDTVPAAIQRHTGLPMYQTTQSPYDLIHTGGNFMTDGLGTGFSSNLILQENPMKSEAGIDSIMNEFMGITRYIKMPTLPYDQIHHIDMHMKLLDEETILMGEYPQGIADGPQIEANLQYILANFNSVFGTPYKVVRVPMPPDNSGAYPNTGGDYRTYANAVFVNKTVILPIYDEQYDTTAIRIWREALPGYTITGINCNSMISALGAIHCITKEVSTADPLLISHQALHDTYNAASPYQVDARILHRSGISQASIYFRTDTLNPYQSTSMNLSSSANDTWTGFIPAQPAGSKVHYYIQAEAVSGKLQVRPLPAPAAYWDFEILLNTTLTENPKSSNSVMSPVFPNPSQGITCIPISTENEAYIEVEIRNSVGQLIEKIYSGKAAGRKNFFVNTGNYSGGVYIIQMSSGDEKTVQKLIVY